MGRERHYLLPITKRLMTDLGERIRLARLRRQLSAGMVAERAGISRNTLHAIEKGEANVTFAAYLNVLLTLGLEKDLENVALDHELGRKLQDLNLPQRIKTRSGPNLKNKKMRNE